MHGTPLGKRHSLEFGESFKHITCLRSCGDVEVTAPPAENAAALRRYQANPTEHLDRYGAVKTLIGGATDRRYLARK
jgi:hypothetical protein